jgi:hypothetical protein
VKESALSFTFSTDSASFWTLSASWVPSGSSLAFGLEEQNSLQCAQHVILSGFGEGN